MCYCTVHIRNNSLKFDISKDKVFLDVPCGKCGQCKKRKSEDTTARIYYEYIRTVATKVPGFKYQSACKTHGSLEIDEHGYVYLQTFTYNDEMVPWKHGIKCFRPEDYRSFMVNLRNDWKRRGFPNSSLRVHWVSEYGGETYRPHHHALFFITAPCSPEEFEELCQRNWCQVVHKGHSGDCFNTERISLGWTELANPYNKNKDHNFPADLVVDGMGALGYCADYVGKDVDFEKVLADQKNSNFDGAKLTDEDYRVMKPYTRQSNGLGDNIKDILTIEQMMEGTMIIPDNVKGSKPIALPLYIDRKVFYDYDPSDKCYRLNELGFKMREQRLIHNRGYVKKQIDWLTSHISTLWNDETKDCVSWVLLTHADKNHTRFHSYSPADAMAFVSDTLYDRYEDFIDYICMYKDITSTYYQYVDDGADLKRLWRAVILKKYDSPPESYCCLSDMKDSLSRQERADYKKIIHDSYGNCCNRFDKFDDVLAILNGINMSVCRMQQRAFLKRKEEESRHKKVLSIINNPHKKFNAYAQNQIKRFRLASASTVS